VRRFLALVAADPRRPLLFGLCGVVALYVGCFAVTSITAGHMIISWGYYYILGVFSLFVFYALRLARSRAEVVRAWVRRPGVAGTAIVLGVLFAVWSDSFKHKILFDEFVIQGTAYTMHATKQVSTIIRAYNIAGTWVLIDPFLDKRPYFFPFLVSLVHDLTGYRLANIFAVNVALAWMLLALLYWFSLQVAGKGPAILAVALMATMPLFGQNATGAGMDLHNLAMIALVASLAVLYLRAPSDDRLSLLVLGSVLLTESRYESAIFMFPVALIVGAGWVRARRVILPWPVVIAPLLLVPCAWHSRVFAATPLFWQLQEGQTSPFGLANMLNNLEGDVAFLFNFGNELTNSWYLTLIGLAGLGWFLFLAWRRVRSRPRPQLPAADFVGIAFGAGVAGHFAVLLFYWWARFDDVMASRFALPLCLSFAILAAALVKGLQDRRIPALRLAAAGLAVWMATGGLPAMARRLYTDENLAMQEIDWEHQIIEARPGPILMISNKSTLPFILWHIESVISAVGAQKGEQIRYHMGQGTFKDVLVTQALRPTSKNGDFGVDPEDAMPTGYHLEVIAEKRFGARVDRVSRIVSIDPAPAGPKAPDQRPNAPSPLRSISRLHSPREPAVASFTSSELSRNIKIE
jgi:Dolichyl-phosphate-mannose-protein mannosyltransferase